MHELPEPYCLVLICRKDVFSLNFQCDPSGDEIAYHFNPRHDEEAVVRNSKIGGDWGDEERDIPHFPFHPGNFFDMFCVATNEGFTVSRTFLANIFGIFHGAINEGFTVYALEI